MDKIWYRNPSESEVIGRCGGDEKTEWPSRTVDNSRTLKNNQKRVLRSLFPFASSSPPENGHHNIKHPLITEPRNNMFECSYILINISINTINSIYKRWFWWGCISHRQYVIYHSVCVLIILTLWIICTLKSSFRMYSFQIEVFNSLLFIVVMFLKNKQMKPLARHLKCRANSNF